LGGGREGEEERKGRGQGRRRRKEKEEERRRRERRAPRGGGGRERGEGGERGGEEGSCGRHIHPPFRRGCAGPCRKPPIWLGVASPSPNMDLETLLRPEIGASSGPLAAASIRGFRASLMRAPLRCSRKSFCKHWCRDPTGIDSGVKLTPCRGRSRLLQLPYDRNHPQPLR